MPTSISRGPLWERTSPGIKLPASPRHFVVPDFREAVEIFAPVGSINGERGRYERTSGRHSLWAAAVLEERRVYVGVVAGAGFGDWGDDRDFQLALLGTAGAKSVRGWRPNHDGVVTPERAAHRDFA